MNKEILYAVAPGRPRRHQNPWFGFALLAASIVTAILMVVFFVLASKEKANTDFNMFQWLAYTMIFATVVAISTGVYFVIVRKKYIQYCESIYQNGKKYNATIIDVLEKTTKSQNDRVDYYYAIKYSFTEDGNLIEATTAYIFAQTEIDYFKSLNFFPILYNKDKNQYLYFLYVEKN